MLWGNAYAQIIRNGKGEVLALYPLMPDRMNADRHENGNIVYDYMVSQEDAPINKGSTVKLQPSEVLHIPGLGFDGLVGYSPIAMAKNAIGLAIATEEYGSKFFANGATRAAFLNFRERSRSLSVCVKAGIRASAVRTNTKLPFWKISVLQVMYEK